MLYNSNNEVDKHLKDKATALSDQEVKRSPRHPNQLKVRTPNYMQLIQARLLNSPRTVNTKHGERVVADAIDGQGNKHTIWRPAGDLKHLTNGSVVKLTVDSKGKVNLIDEPYALAPVPPAEAGKLSFDTESQLKSHMGFTANPQPSRSVEIADYIDRLGKLYSHCLTTAASMPTSIELEAPQIKDVATTFFIQAVRHFDL